MASARIEQQPIVPVYRHTLVMHRKERFGNVRAVYWHHSILYYGLHRSFYFWHPDMVRMHGEWVLP